MYRMKKLLGILVLVLFTLQTPSWADDIRDFQIEGMSIGDSLLDYFGEDKIKNHLHFPYISDKYALWVNPENVSFEIFDGIQVHVKKNDPQYIIKGLDGHIYYYENIKECYPKKKEIKKDLKKLFYSAQEQNDTSKHYLDKSGKSKVEKTIFQFTSGDSIYLVCYDWSKKMQYGDKLSVSIRTKEIMDFINNDGRGDM